MSVISKSVQQQALTRVPNPLQGQPSQKTRDVSSVSNRGSQSVSHTEVTLNELNVMPSLTQTTKPNTARINGFTTQFKQQEAAAKKYGLHIMFDIENKTFSLEINNDAPAKKWTEIENVAIKNLFTLVKRTSQDMNNPKHHLTEDQKVDIGKAALKDAPEESESKTTDSKLAVATAVGAALVGGATYATWQPNRNTASKMETLKTVVDFVQNSGQAAAARFTALFPVRLLPASAATSGNNTIPFNCSYIGENRSFHSLTDPQIYANVLEVMVDSLLEVPNVNTILPLPGGKLWENAASEAATYCNSSANDMNIRNFVEAVVQNVANNWGLVASGFNALLGTDDTSFSSLEEALISGTDDTGVDIQTAFGSLAVGGSYINPNYVVDAEDGGFTYKGTINYITSMLAEDGITFADSREAAYLETAISGYTTDQQGALVTSAYYNFLNENLNSLSTDNKALAEYILSDPNGNGQINLNGDKFLTPRADDPLGIVAVN